MGHRALPRSFFFVVLLVLTLAWMLMLLELDVSKTTVGPGGVGRTEIDWLVLGLEAAVGIVVAVGWIGFRRRAR